jgi:hypothetical protein
VNDFAQLQELKQRIAKTGSFLSGGFLGEARDLLKRESMLQIEREFRTGTDPYGRPWAQAKDRPGSPLERSGELAESWKAATTAAGFADASALPRARFMEFGVTKIGKRTRGPGLSKNQKFTAGGFSGPLRKARSRRLSFPRQKALVPRLMVPNSDNLGNWGVAFEKAADGLMDRWFR